MYCLIGTQGVAPGPVIGLQAPSTGLLGARPGLIPLQRPPGMPPPHLQRFPLMPPRPMPPHMMHRGPPPGPGGFGMPPPHGMKGPFPPHGPFVRPGGMPGLGGPGPGPGVPEDRDGRQQQPPPPQQQQQQQKTSALSPNAKEFIFPNMQGQGSSTSGMFPGDSPLNLSPLQYSNAFDVFSAYGGLNEKSFVDGLNFSLNNMQYSNQQFQPVMAN